jgi:Ca2+-binding RTX toxin-like protein
LPGTYVFAAGQVVSGPIASITVEKSGNAAYAITGFDLKIEELWADAGDNGKLDTVPAKVFQGDDTLNGSPFDDILFAFAGNDVVLGGDGNDEMNGGDGSDDLTGGRGADTQTGGAGADTFIFLARSDSTKKTSGRDHILDFNRDEGDEVDLSAIDAKKGGGNQAFKFIKKHDFNDKKGELRYKVKDGDAYLQGDTDGNGKADFSIHFDNLSKLKAIDFDL